MKTFFTALLTVTFASAAFAEVNLKPGLWEIKTKMEGPNGQDPMAKLRESMAKMSPEQRKQMQAMMGNSGVGLGNDGSIKVCYSKDSFKNHDSLLTSAQKSKCKTTIKEQSSTKMVMDFKCDNGSEGTAEWKTIGETKYTSVMNFTSAKSGRKGTINHEGKFVKSDCGSVKPIGQK